MPKRIQLRRVKGWRLPEGARSVAPPARWCNPFKVGDGYDQQSAVARHRVWFLDPHRTEGPTVAEARRNLRGHDLACWCRLDEPCHADVLLEIANA